jgi:hypothetical protein
MTEVQKVSFNWVCGRKVFINLDLCGRTSAGLLNDAVVRSAWAVASIIASGCWWKQVLYFSFYLTYVIFVDLIGGFFRSGEINRYSSFRSGQNDQRWNDGQRDFAVLLRCVHWRFRTP